ncbi:AI-2E family transporter [Gracilimonas tropica]|uniref:AI-2E family transporter n=1 Tax=Gracilimonas tropica TaxID=454600 RepID=UPI000377C32C|nr:AI-2E family transporter [Gracilimonas tropica]
MESFSHNRLLSITLWFMIIFMTGYVLAIAEKFLIPLVLALFLWYLVNMLAKRFGELRVGRWTLPAWLQFLLSGFVILLIVILILNVLTGSISAMIEAAPSYQEKLIKMITELEGWPRFIAMALPLNPITETNIDGLVQNAAAEFGNFLVNIGLIAIYMFFLFMEQRYISGKLASVSPTEKQLNRLSKLLKEIDHDVQAYLGVKTFVSLLTSVISWVIMWLTGLEFAGFWALMIFVLNFIPNLGSIIATILPGIMALVQFETVTPFFIILIGIGTVQFLIGNVMEPAMMGRSLNISPLVIIISLVAWGVLWGIPGMFLSIPITMVAILIMYNFEQTRWVALLLSRDGKLKHESGD